MTSRPNAPRGLCSVLLAIALSSCASGPMTVYSGTYTRTWIDAAGRSRQASGPVVLTLAADGRYRIESESADLPPGGSGRYERIDDVLILHDTAPSRAGFDLSRIVSGEFEIASDESSLVLTRDDPWGSSELLILDEVSPE